MKERTPEELEQLAKDVIELHTPDKDTPNRVLWMREDPNDRPRWAATVKKSQPEKL